MNAHTALFEQIDAAALDEDIKAKLRDEVERGQYRGLLLANMEQEKRDKRAALTPVSRRRFDYAENDSSLIRKEDVRLVHSMAALCGLPYKALPDGQDIYTKRNGPYSLSVQSGYLIDPTTGNPVKQGVPYGSKARLLFVHICNEAIKTNSQEIEIADSLTGFMRELGFAVTGGERGTLPQFKEQLSRLASCSMLLGYADGQGGADTEYRKPIKRVSLWIPRKPDQPMLWKSTLMLDSEFFSSLRDHKMPVDIRALQAVSQSPRKMDMVLWLTYRSRHLERPLAISWAQLQAQFSDSSSNLRSFKQKFSDDVKAISELFGRRLKLVLQEDRLIVYPMDVNGSHAAVDGRGLVPKRRITEQNAAKQVFKSRYSKSSVKSNA